MQLEERNPSNTHIPVPETLNLPLLPVLYTNMVATVISYTGYLELPLFLTGPHY